IIFTVFKFNRIKMTQNFILFGFLLLINLCNMGRLSAQATQIPDWENPGMFNQNKETPHTNLMPFRTVAEALSLKKNQSVYYKTLSGTWKFNWVRKPADRPVDFYKPEYNVSGWDEIPVPSNWEIQGYGIP